MSNKDEQAFPGDEEWGVPKGLTKREYAAIHLTAAIIARSSDETWRKISPEQVAIEGLEQADAIFAELEKMP